MKVLIISDSYKGSFSSKEVNQMIYSVLKERFQDWEVTSEEISDGGEGWLSILKNKLTLESYVTSTFDPIGRPLEGYWLLDVVNKTAYIEMAIASGLTLLSKEERNPWKTSSYGTGVLVQKAIEKGVKKIVLGLGGSSTNDVGAGLLEALGIEFVDSNNQIIKSITPDSFHLVKHLQNTPSLSTLFTIATDVKNPLLGKMGATQLFASQKGATENEIGKLEDAVKTMVSNYLNRNPHLNVSIPGMGAAGGVAAGVATFFPVIFTTGFDVLSEVSDLKNKIKNVDLIITGEGRTDASTLLGKAPQRIAQLAKEYNKKTILISGSVDSKLSHELHVLFDIIVPLQNRNEILEETIQNTPTRIKDRLLGVLF